MPDAQLLRCLLGDCEFAMLSQWFESYQNQEHMGLHVRTMSWRLRTLPTHANRRDLEKREKGADQLLTAFEG